MLKNLGHSVLIATAVALPILLGGGDATHFSWGGKRALAQDESLTNQLSFTVENFTNYTLLEFYVSPTDVSTWEEEAEKLQDHPVAPGDVREIVVDDSRSDCFYDVRGVFDNGQTIDENQVDLCINEGTYTYYDDDDVTFNVVNQTSDTLVRFYFTPASDPTWGDDLLGDQVIPPGESADIPINSSECSYDFKAEFEDGETLEERGVDVCQDNSITFEDQGGAQ